MGRASLHVYRLFLREARKLATKDMAPQIRRPIPDQWGSYGFTEVGSEYQKRALASMLPPSLRSLTGLERGLTPADLRFVVRDQFKRHRAADEADVPRLMGEALAALRVLHEQVYLHRCSSAAVTEGVRVEATSKYAQSGPDQGAGRTAHLFTYRIRVINERDEPIKVMGREWTIKNDKGQMTVHVPHSPGNAVVGQQPVLPPGAAFEYLSGTDLDTPSGLQSGKLEIAVLSKERPARTVATLMAMVAPFAHIRPDVA